MVKVYKADVLLIQRTVLFCHFYNYVNIIDASTCNQHFNVDDGGSRTDAAGFAEIIYIKWIACVFF